MNVNEAPREVFHEDSGSSKSADRTGAHFSRPPEMPLVVTTGAFITSPLGPVQ